LLIATSFVNLFSTQLKEKMEKAKSKLKAIIAQKYINNEESTKIAKELRDELNAETCSEPLKEMVIKALKFAEMKLEESVAYVFVHVMQAASVLTIDEAKAKVFVECVEAQILEFRVDSPAPTPAKATDAKDEYNETKLREQAPIKAVCNAVKCFVSSKNTDGKWQNPTDEHLVKFNIVRDASNNILSAILDVCRGLTDVQKFKLRDSGVRQELISKLMDAFTESTSRATLLMKLVDLTVKQAKTMEPGEILTRKPLPVDTDDWGYEEFTEDFIFIIYVAVVRHEGYMASKGFIFLLHELQSRVLLKGLSALDEMSKWTASEIKKFELAFDYERVNRRYQSWFRSIKDATFFDSVTPLTFEEEPVKRKRQESTTLSMENNRDGKETIALTDVGGGKTTATPCKAGDQCCHACGWMGHQVTGCPFQSIMKHVEIDVQAYKVLLKGKLRLADLPNQKAWLKSNFKFALKN